MRSSILISLLFLSCICNAQIITTIAGTDTAGYTGNGGPANKARLDYPSNIAFDKTGNLYISDQNNNVIRKVDKSGIITIFAGNGYGAGTLSGGYSGDGGPATVAELNGPIGIAFDFHGNLYIADAGNDVIRKVDTAGIITTIAGNGSSTYTGDSGLAINAGMSPYGVACDNAGDFFIADGVHLRVRKVNKAGIITTVAGGGTSLSIGIPATSANLTYPGIIAIGPFNDLYIPDWTHHRVCKVDAKGILVVAAGNGLFGNNGDGGLAIDAELNAPNAVTFDKDGNMYISDNFANVVRKVNTAGIISTIAGSGTQGYAGDGGPATKAELNDPNDAMIGPDGNLYFADVNNNVIRKVTYNTAVRNITTNINCSISPNPAKDQITIHATQPITTIQITNTIGQLVYSHTYNSTNNLQLTVSNYPTGIYFLRINNTYVQKLIKE